MTENVNNASKTRGRPFEPGNSGRKPGSRNRRTVLAEKLMDKDAKAIIEAVILAAKSGDMTAARLILERIAPAPKGRRMALALPPVETAADVKSAFRDTLQAMSDGEISPDEAATVAGILESKRRAIETVELEQRLAALEAAKEKRK